MKKKIYQEIRPFSRAEVATVIEKNNPDELLYVPIAVSLYQTDLAFAQDVCIRLASHEHFNVRGNAILGFGHLARRFKRLDFESIIKPLIEGALNDADNYVRGHADDAADDVEFFLKWKIKRHEQI